MLSVGPYNAISAVRLGLPEDEWITLSDRIWKYHECTHFVCRRLFPEKKNAVWDELVADAVGIYAAFGKYNPRMEELFLGIEDGRYVGGRLENYVTDLSGEERAAVLSELADKISSVLKDFDKVISENSSAAPFELALLLEDSMKELWG